VKEYEVIFEHKGKPERIRVPANSRDEAEQAALRHQYRRQARIPLTFARLEAEKPRTALEKARFAYELERRKLDLGRFDGNSQFKVIAVTEVHK
jgi:hypothetical protein